jgi:hypothetical protein
VGGEMDVTEYLLNFIERIEEGLDELPKKGAPDQVKDPFPVSQEPDQTLNRESSNVLFQSYIDHTKKIDAEPITPKVQSEFTNKIDENFFGEQTMVTKLKNTMTNSEKVISRIKERLGPIMLKMRYGNLVDDWYDSTSTTVDDYKVSRTNVAESQKLSD